MYVGHTAAIPSCCSDGASGSPHEHATRRREQSDCRASHAACVGSRVARRRKEADALKMVTRSEVTAIAKHSARRASTIPTATTEVTRVSSAPLSPYDCPVIHEGEASTKTTSSPGRTSRQTSIVCATPHR